jgi:hypothetical protein
VTSIQSIILEMPDPTAASGYYGAAFDLGSRLDVRTSDTPSSRFRAFMLSLASSQPADVDELISSSVDAGATLLKPAEKSLWGYGGTVQAHGRSDLEGRDVLEEEHRPGYLRDRRRRAAAGSRGRTREQMVLRRPRPDRSGASGRAYVEFATDGIQLGLYKRGALAKDAGVPPDGTGSHGSRSSQTPGRSSIPRGSRGKVHAVKTPLDANKLIRNREARSLVAPSQPRGRT